MFTVGHPNPIASTPPYSELNLPVIKSVEGSDSGYLVANGAYSLAHVFQMTNDKWNGGAIVWVSTLFHLVMPSAFDHI